jgi:prophage maintenance system killer protein
LEIKLDQKNDTIWLTQDQLSLLFDKERSVISKHIKNIFADEELEEKRVCAFFARTASDGKTYQTQFYNLDLILSVGYRTNSKRATKFRQWANTVLKDYLLKGYSLNQKLLETKRNQILEIKQTLHFLVKSSKNLESSELFLEILERFSESLVLLNKYDEDRLVVQNTSKSVKVEIENFRQMIAQTKQELIEKNEATELFGQEYEGKFESTISAIYQTFGGNDLYPSLEEKAANLLYLTIKNHSFVDGNKRIGSILFVYFLAKNNFLYKPTGQLKIDQNTLVALALLVAQSKPTEKEILIKLIVNLIQN